MQAFLMILPTLLKFVGWIVGKQKNAEETQAAMAELIKKAAQDGLISLQAKDSLTAQKNLILEQIKKDKQTTTKEKQ